jgi:hypothetical protein
MLTTPLRLLETDLQTEWPAARISASAAVPARRSDWLVVAGILFAALVVRVQTLADPVLGFDEQYYLLVADRMLHGAVPYVDIWDRKPIGLFLIYAAAIGPNGDPFLQYKLLALAFVVATAFIIYRAALRDAGRFGAAAAALLYVFWLNFMEGEGGQAPVFFNLPMLLAALLVRRVVERRGGPVLCGLAAMSLVGMALQIKYTAVSEGLFLGGTLVWAAYRQGRSLPGLALIALVWAGCALTPTLLAWAVYVAMGHGQEFVFANFFSLFGRWPDPLADRMLGLTAIVVILAPLAVVAMLAARRRAGRAFVELWALAAIFGVLAVGAFLSPNYALPVVAPLCLCAAPWLDSTRRGRLVAAMLLALSGIGGTLVVRQAIIGKGNRAEALAVAAAAQPVHGGCIWVWDGYPALYLLTHSRVPTKWAFPGHLNTLNEATPLATGADPPIEVRRILATRPEAIVDDYPAYRLGNPTTRAIVQAEIARSYQLVARIQTGKGRFRLVYRLK